MPKEEKFKQVLVKANDKAYLRQESIASDRYQYDIVHDALDLYRQWHAGKLHRVKGKHSTNYYSLKSGKVWSVL
ncbi:MAG: hypothetical protein K9N46_09385 [Candidatus Marinimicrobia bacterium]|nr:hypothetical protein [Candidatus Neomarinimicrobiota bacterium]MCF7829450.1 hypothetical protein [Candidatus Neomarinimicrobiota bacterium]MCF7880936.1 hypothetical protein [Candidatus Neomarinimicrobiota bacterium]